MPNTTRSGPTTVVPAAAAAAHAAVAVASTATAVPGAPSSTEATALIVALVSSGVGLVIVVCWLAIRALKEVAIAQERIRASAQERREMRAVNGDDFYLSDQALLAPFSHATLPSASSRPVLRPFTMVAP